jgi:hypothetical protein
MTRWIHIGLFSLLSGVNAVDGALLHVTVQQEAIYTPGTVRLSFVLTDAATLAGPYRIRAALYLAGATARDREVEVTRPQATLCELPVPELDGIVKAVCRIELFQDDAFLEAHELPVSLWSRHHLEPAGRCGTRVWAVDPSGVLLSRLSEFGIEAADASFQAVRDLRVPEIVFVGERLDEENMRLTFDRVRQAQDVVTIVFGQDRLTGGFDAAGITVTDPCHPVIAEPNSVLLTGLSSRDAMWLLNDARPLRIKRRPDRSIHSHLTAVESDSKVVLSYLSIVEQHSRTTLYCQLPATDRDDPRQMVLLRNILQFACERAERARSARATSDEREKP